MGYALLGKVGIHLLKIGAKAARSKLTGVNHQLSKNEKKALALTAKAKRALKSPKKRMQEDHDAIVKKNVAAFKKHYTKTKGK